MITREPVFPMPTDSCFESLRRMVLLALADAGLAGRITLQALLGLPRLLKHPDARRSFVRQLCLAGIGSLPVMTVVAVFTGMILALQTGIELRRLNQELYIGSAVMVSMLREMGPFMTGLIMASCVGSSMAAQLGTMAVNEEIAALEMMSIDPVRFLVTPRIWALMLMMPLLSFYTCALGLIGGGVIGMTQLNIGWDQYFSIAMRYAENKDLYVGLLKALLFGVVIAGISCFFGLTTTQGAVGVGRATRLAVLGSFLMILVVGYVVTRFFYTFY